MTRKAASFSALIRWRSSVNSAWEIDTRHSGYRSAEDAALVANGLGGDGFDRLVLQHGELFTIDVNGHRLQVGAEIVTWVMPAAPVDLPEDLQFERVDSGLSGLSASGLEGTFEARRFRVVDDETGLDVSVRLAVGHSRVVVLVGGLRARVTADVDVPVA